MKKFLKLLTFSLALLMVLSTAFACAKDIGPSAGTDGSGDVVDSESESVDLMEDIPTGDYAGYKFKMVVPEYVWASYSIDMLGGVGTAAFNKAVYERNQKVEKALNIVLDCTHINAVELATEIRTQVKASSPDNYDAMWQQASRTSILSQEGCLYDLTTAEALNLSKPWWYTDFAEDVHLGDKRYVMFGALNTIYHSAFGICAFNKDLLEVVDKEADLYQIYNDGQWTLEKMNYYMKLASSEANGDSVRDTRDDYFGLAQHHNTLYQMLTSCGQTVTTEGANGYPTYNGLSATFISTWEYIVDNISDPNYACIPGITNGYSEYQHNGGDYNTVFAEGRALLLIQSCGALTEINNADVNYGVIGYPKLDEDSDYRSPVYYGVAGVCVLTNNMDIERTATILENMSAYSYGSVDLDFIENTLYYKYTQEASAVETLQKVLETGTIDIAYVYEKWLGDDKSMNRYLQEALKARNRNVVSLFAEIENTLKSNIQKSVIFYARG